MGQANFSGPVQSAGGYKVGDSEVINSSGEIATTSAAPSLGTTVEGDVYSITIEWDSTNVDGNNDLIIYNANAPKLSILDVAVDMETTVGGLTAVLRTGTSGGGDPLTNSMDVNKSAERVRATQVVQDVVSANSSLVLNFSGVVAIGNGCVYILARRVT